MAFLIEINYFLLPSMHVHIITLSDSKSQCLNNFGVGSRSETSHEFTFDSPVYLGRVTIGRDAVMRTIRQRHKTAFQYNGFNCTLYAPYSPRLYRRRRWCCHRRRNIWIECNILIFHRSVSRINFKFQWHICVWVRARILLLFWAILFSICKIFGIVEL